MMRCTLNLRKVFHYERIKKRPSVAPTTESIWAQTSPQYIYDKLSVGLIEKGFHKSNIDPCLFLKRDMVCVIYVDDTILAGPDSQVLEEEIKGLGVADDEQRHKFELRTEGEVGDFWVSEFRSTATTNLY